MRVRPHLFPLLALGALAPRVAAEPPGSAPPPSGPVVGSGVAAKDRTAIAWYGTWEGALAEARRSGRPILLLAAAPQCAGGISGLW